MDKMIEDIIVVAQRENAEHDITGILAFDKTQHLVEQYVEGPRERVDQLIDNIRRDPRLVPGTFELLFRTTLAWGHVFPSWKIELVEDLTQFHETLVVKLMRIKRNQTLFE